VVIVMGTVFAGVVPLTTTVQTPATFNGSTGVTSLDDSTIDSAQGQEKREERRTATVFVLEDIRGS